MWWHGCFESLSHPEFVFKFGCVWVCIFESVSYKNARSVPWLLVCKSTTLHSTNDLICWKSMWNILQLYQNANDIVVHFASPWWFSMLYRCFCNIVYLNLKTRIIWVTYTKNSLHKVLTSTPEWSCTVTNKNVPSVKTCCYAAYRELGKSCSQGRKWQDVYSRQWEMNLAHIDEQFSWCTNSQLWSICLFIFYLRSYYLVSFVDLGIFYNIKMRNWVSRLFFLLLCGKHQLNWLT